MNSPPEGGQRLRRYRPWAAVTMQRAACCIRKIRSARGVTDVVGGGHSAAAAPEAFAVPEARRAAAASERFAGSCRVARSWADSQ